MNETGTEHSSPLHSGAPLPGEAELRAALDVVYQPHMTTSVCAEFFDEGFEAGVSGVLPGECPHAGSTLAWAMWQLGWEIGSIDLDVREGGTA